MIVPLFVILSHIFKTEFAPKVNVAPGSIVRFLTTTVPIAEVIFGWKEEEGETIALIPQVGMVHPPQFTLVVQIVVLAPPVHVTVAGVP